MDYFWLACSHHLVYGSLSYDVLHLCAQLVRHLPALRQAQASSIQLQREVALLFSNERLSSRDCLFHPECEYRSSLLLLRGIRLDDDTCEGIVGNQLQKELHTKTTQV
jgi:hypothetical protein